VSASIRTEAIDLPEIAEATLMLVINQFYVAGSSQGEVYEATRGHWRVGPETRRAAQLVLGVADGVVRGAFRPTTWFASPISGQEGRWGFEGVIAPEFDHIVGTSIARLPVLKGASNPVRLYLEGVPAIGEEGRAAESQWELEPGDFLGRKERSILFGGSLQGGIQPSAQSPNIFLYSDLTRAGKSAYQFDGWNADSSVFFYTGEGQTGDQKLLTRNLSLLNHVAHGRSVRLFAADGYEFGSNTARHRYIGHFKVDPELPYESAVSRDESGEPRTVFVFRLLPIGRVLVTDRERSAAPLFEVAEVAELSSEDEEAEAFTREIKIEAVMSGESAQEVQSRLRVSRRREAFLVLDLRNALVARGHRVQRHQIRPAGHSNSIYTDLFDSTEGVLYEAKSDSSRESIRMAIGQLFDYKRFLPAETRLSVLVPTEPGRDLCQLLASVGVEICCPDPHGVFQF
jgi:hypothetical protein